MALHNVVAGVAAGTGMDLVDAPNATAITAINNGMATAAALATVDGIVDDILLDTATIGTLTNTGGGATLGAILGDPANVSLAQRLIAIEAVAEEIEHHFHTKARWFGKLASQTGTDWADNTLAPYRVISGANVYGAGASDHALVFGTDDTVIAGQTKYDADAIMVVASNSVTPWKLRFVWGTTTLAQGITDGNWTETMVQVASASSRLAKEYIRMPRLTIGVDQLWCQGWNGTDDATLDFLVGIHGYDV